MLAGLLAYAPMVKARKIRIRTRVVSQTRGAVATAFEQTHGWQLTREDGPWYRMGDAVRTGNVQLYHGCEDCADSVSVVCLCAPHFGRTSMHPKCRSNVGQM
jgi:hypothetical protein